MDKSSEVAVRYIGLDLSITGTGFAIFDEDCNLLKSGVIKSKTGAPDIIRFNRTANELVEAVQFQPGDKILIEDYAFSAKGQITRLAEFGATVKNKVFQVLGTFSGIRLCAPPTLKKFATGKGNTQKQVVILEVYRKWSFMTHNDNEADAYVLGRMCHQLWHSQQNATKQEMECIKALHKKNNTLEEYYESPKFHKEEAEALRCKKDSDETGIPSKASRKPFGKAKRKLKKR